MTQCIPYDVCHEKVVKSYKAKSPELIALELGLKGAVLVCSHRNARLAAKCCEGTINPKLLVPHHCLPSKKVSRSCMTHPRLCSLCPLHGGASFSHCFVACTFSGRRFGVLRKFLWSAWGKEVEALHGRVRCHE
jgi:hypothetical protein